MPKKDKKGSKPKLPVGHPPFVATDEDRAVVKLFVGMGMSREKMCLRICRDGKPISISTLEKHFDHELKCGKTEMETVVLSKLWEAVKEGKQWAIEKYLAQRMWRAESGGWRTDSGFRVSLGGEGGEAHGASDGVPPLQLVVQFVSPKGNSDANDPDR